MMWLSTLGIVLPRVQAGADRAHSRVVDDGVALEAA
ncbi:hypothetical protein LAUMK191_05660 [Mycobacterium attenuatum]|uniref:Uncharacterized protein n=1 Tax=Mycobacterium attenuatum TaxID=2341086 RepID=A0A498PVG4_9MYCO|nr:hypothetical protein LAUMK136_02097 [Mycobacterium attenuatum]VBA60738.1 hypothetical protein LAUMK191_05660 [Mycobacterium attenuatum]VBA62481.1 hypothetical protein LAUMK41_05872 [Mycobacterium attenuatum]